LAFVSSAAVGLVAVSGLVLLWHGARLLREAGRAEAGESAARK
jgi:hypothetical protein